MHTVSHIKTNSNNDRYGSSTIIMYSVFFLSGFKENGQSCKDSSEDDSETRSQEINKE